MVRRSGDRPTVSDLVVLSLLTERPMHGYEINQELVRCDVKDWAGISRAQVYYSIRKLLEKEWVAPVARAAAGAGPERQVVRPTRSGRRVLADALEDEDWASQRVRPPFLTWLALSHLARPRAVKAGVRRRRAFLEAELARERVTLEAIRADSGPMIVAAQLMVELTIRQFETELAWLDGVESRLAGL